MSCDCLGSFGYRAQILERPSPNRRSVEVAEFPVISADWSRVLNDISSASVEVPVHPDCCTELNYIASRVAPQLFELHLWRNDNDTGGPVWAGPLVGIEEDPSGAGEAETVSLSARGPLAWSSWRVFAFPMPYSVGGPGQITWSGVDLTTIFEDWWSYLMSKDDPLIEVITSLSGITGDRSVTLSELPVGWTVLKELVDSGVNTVEYGRTILAGNLDTLVPRLPVITEEWFGDPVATRVIGDSQATRVWVKGEAGVIGLAGGPDPATGLLLEQTVDDSEAEDIASAVSRAELEVAFRGQSLVFADGDNNLRASAPVCINDLVPGAIASIDLSQRCLTTLSDMRLAEVSVSYTSSDDDTSGEESVSVQFESLGVDNE